MTGPARKIDTAIIEDNIVRMIFDASFRLLPEVEDAFSRIRDCEKAKAARMTMDIIIENSRIARERQLPLCQDCGSVSVFIELGQSVCLCGAPLPEAVDRAVATAYERFYLRKSIVGDPLERINTGTNTPAFLHVDIVPGDRLKMSVYLKGGGYVGYDGFFHGIWKGPYWTAGEKWNIGDPKVADEMHGLDDTVCEYRCGKEVGYGIIENLVLGSFPKYGF